MERSRIVEWEMQDDFGILTIDNLPQNFLVDPEFMYLDDLRKWTANESLKGIIVRGKGRHFCAGVDQKSLFKPQGTVDNIQETLRKGKAVLEHFFNLPIPIVAAIEGVCLGGGLEVALACHIRVASKKALFSLPETSLGVMPGLYGTIVLPGMVGMCKSIELALAGETIGAEEALRLGLIDHIVPAKGAFDFALEFLKKATTDRPVHVIHSIVKSINNARLLPFEEAMEEQINMFCDLVLRKKEEMGKEQ
ncbi:enoyl-CoA hydratase/isomerase family protein [Acidobacteriota bacterium]